MCRSPTRDSGRNADIRHNPAISHFVATLVAPWANPFELAVACEVFGIDRSYLADPWYEFAVVGGGDGGRVQTTGGMIVQTTHGLDTLRRADTIIVTPWESAEDDGVVPVEVLDALRDAAERGARLVSFCTGAFVLGAAGLLDGRPVTTHWMHADELERRHPSAAVDPGVLYVDDGQVLTSAGTAASIDLSLHIVRCDHGAEVANAVARAMVVPPHRDGGQAQYVEMPVEHASGPDPLRSTLEWTLDHLDEPLTVDALAARAHMSPRTFARRFRATTGVTPHQWLLRQRVLHAQRLLETTGQPVERVAHAAGFGSAGAMRLHFQRALGTSPQAYRRTFRVKSGRVRGGAAA